MQHSVGDHQSRTSTGSDSLPSLGPEPLQLVIARPPEINSCPFWRSHYRQGIASTRDLMQCEQLEDFFRLLNEQGLAETKPLMLSDNSQGKTPRQFYIFPEVKEPAERETTKVLVHKVLEALKPEKLGLYFGANHTDKQFCQQFIEEIAIDASFLRTKELYFYTGEMGVNSLLNIALRVKAKLEGRRDVFVYH